MSRWLLSHDSGVWGPLAYVEPPKTRIGGVWWLLVDAVFCTCLARLALGAGYDHHKVEEKRPTVVAAAPGLSGVRVLLQNYWLQGRESKRNARSEE